MGKNLKIGLIILGVIVVLIVTGVGVNSYIDNRLIKETAQRVKIEEMLEQKAKEFDIVQLEKAALKEDKIKLQAVVDYQSKNPTIIIQKYEKEHSNIDNLSNSKQFELFSINLYEYNSNKERYSLLRFK